MLNQPNYMNTEQEQIKSKNELIKRAIFVSQMQDHKGFQVFMDDTIEIKNGVQFADIRGIKDSKELNYNKGYVQALDDLIHYFKNQKNWAMKPMIDEKTGEEEVLNNKDK